MSAVWRGEKPAKWLFTWFMATVAIGPTAIFWAVFGVLLSIEGTALPWLVFIIAPALNTLIIFPLALWLGVGTYRAAQGLGRPGLLLRALVLTSYLWAPIFAYLGFGALLAAIQKIPAH